MPMGAAEAAVCEVLSDKKRQGQLRVHIKTKTHTRTAHTAQSHTARTCAAPHARPYAHVSARMQPYTQMLVFSRSQPHGRYCCYTSCTVIGNKGKQCCSGCTKPSATVSVAKVSATRTGCAKVLVPLGPCSNELSAVGDGLSTTCSDICYQVPCV